MSRRSIFGIAGGLVMAMALGSPAAAAKLHVFTVVERATSDTVVDLEPAGDSVGDLLAFGNRLYGRLDQHAVGRDEGSCVRTNPGVAWECSWTNILPRGHITVQGPFRDDGSDTWLSITGGTGRYTNARGQMKLHWRNATGTEYDFVFYVRY